MEISYVPKTNSKISVSNIERIIGDYHTLLGDYPSRMEIIEVPANILHNLPVSRNIHDLIRNLHTICNHLRILRDPSRIQHDDKVVSRTFSMPNYFNRHNSGYLSPSKYFE